MEWLKTIKQSKRPEAEKGNRVGTIFKTNIMETKRREFAKGKTIYVSIPAGFNIEQTQTVTKEIMNMAGCQHCHSGFNLNFVDEVEFVAARIGAQNQVEIF